MTSKGSKLIAITLVAVAVGAGFGYWVLVPKMPGQLLTYTTQQTSIVTSSEETLSTSTSSTTVVPETTLWINVTATKPVSYYLSLLKSTQTQPYVQLGWELQALPDATNVTAVAKITYLALNASNPEVKEAFQLMMKGGTPSPTDFTYTVPNYNTELQVLYWLASQNGVKRDDTLALAIAMANGLWVTMGDQQVRDSVRKDTSDLLSFFRETNELQKQSNLPQLETYPLEALTCLSWMGSMNGIGGPHGVAHGSNAEQVHLKLYLWDTPSIDTLRRMRDMMTEKHWLGRNVDSTVANVEEYFYFSGFEQHWNYTTETEEQIEVDGEKVKNWEIYNVDYYFRHYVETGKGRGDCGDETSFIDGWLKSWGYRKQLRHTSDNSARQILRTCTRHLLRTYLPRLESLQQTGLRQHVLRTARTRILRLPIQTTSDPARILLMGSDQRNKNGKWWEGFRLEVHRSVFQGRVRNGCGNFTDEAVAALQLVHERRCHGQTEIPQLRNGPGP